jgi:DNA-binding GntR family transcriptional regulator
MNSLPKLDRTRASDSVFEVLRDSILTRVFRPGDRLDVKAVATQLGVSPTPVKDAINRLAAEG